MLAADRELYSPHGPIGCFQQTIPITSTKLLPVDYQRYEPFNFSSKSKHANGIAAQMSLQDSSAGSWKPVNQTIIQEELVCEFLDHRMKSAELDAFLQQDSVSHTSSVGENPSPDRFMYALPLEQSVQHNFSRLEEHCRMLFQGTSRCCSQSFKPLGYYSLPTLLKYVFTEPRFYTEGSPTMCRDQQGRPMIRNQNYVDSESEASVHVIAYAFELMSKEHIALLRIKGDGTCEALLLAIEGFSLLQMEFYTTSTLALLVSQDDGECSLSWF